MAREFVDALRQVLDARRDRERDVVDARVVGRNPDGTTQEMRLDGECTARACARNYYEGQVVQRGASTCFTSIGTSGVALIGLSGLARLLWVEKLEPNLFQGGQGYDVVVTGRGFTTGTRFEFLDAGSGEVNPWIAIVAATFVDSSTFELAIAVSPEAPALVDGDLAYDDAGIAF